MKPRSRVSSSPAIKNEHPTGAQGPRSSGPSPTPRLSPGVGDVARPTSSLDAASLAAFPLSWPQIPKVELKRFQRSLLYITHVYIYMWVCIIVVRNFRMQAYIYYNVYYIIYIYTKYILYIHIYIYIKYIIHIYIY